MLAHLSWPEDHPDWYLAVSLHAICSHADVFEQPHTVLRLSLSASAKGLIPFEAGTDVAHPAVISSFHGPPNDFSSQGSATHPASL